MKDDYKNPVEQQTEQDLVAKIVAQNVALLEGMSSTNKEETDMTSTTVARLPDNNSGTRKATVIKGISRPYSKSNAYRRKPVPRKPVVGLLNLRMGMGDGGMKPIPVLPDLSQQPQPLIQPLIPNQEQTGILKEAYEKGEKKLKELMRRFKELNKSSESSLSDAERKYLEASNQAVSDTLNSNSSVVAPEIGGQFLGVSPQSSNNNRRTNHREKPVRKGAPRNR